MITQVLKLRPSLRVLDGKKVDSCGPSTKSRLKVKRNQDSTGNNTKDGRKERRKTKEQTEGRECEEDEQSVAKRRKRKAVEARTESEQEYNDAIGSSTSMLSTNTGEMTKNSDSTAEAIGPQRKKPRTRPKSEPELQKELSSAASKVVIGDSKESSQALKRELTKSLSRAKGHSGIVAVTDAKRKVKRQERKWDPFQFSSKAETLQIGHGQTSTWT